MTLDKELKESLNLSFKYLRAYGEPEIMSAVDGWQEVYGEGGLVDQADEDAIVEEEVADDTPPPRQQTEPLKDAPEDPDVEKPSRGLGMGTKIILSIAAIWGLVTFATMVKMFF